MTYQDWIVQYPFAEDNRVVRDAWNAAVAMSADAAQEVANSLGNDPDLAAAKVAALEVKEAIKNLIIEARW